jgi:hypothetical protein
MDWPNVAQGGLPTRGARRSESTGTNGAPPGTMHPMTVGLRALRVTLAATLAVMAGGCADGANSGRGAADAETTPAEGGGVGDAGGDADADAGGDADAGRCPPNFCACSCLDGGAGYRPQCDPVACTSTDPCISGLDADGGWLLCGL